MKFALPALVAVAPLACSGSGEHAASITGGSGGANDGGANGDGADNAMMAPDAGDGGSGVSGSFDHPFAADSLWNSQPVSPVLGTDVIPPTARPDFYPAIGGGTFSTAGFLATASDPPMAIHGLGNAAEPNCSDVGAACPVTIPHWPASVVPASGGDGHADVVDVDAGIIHSFWQLQKDGSGIWRANQYAWSPLRGSGWGDPAHTSQGARASGVCTIAGLIRIAESNDGEPMFHHVLALSLDGTAMKPGFVFPATLEDSDAKTAYKGPFPMGTLLMLPPTFDTSKIGSPGLLKVVKTLQTYGARVVDRNGDTPFVIYVENGSTFSVSTKPAGQWDATVENQLFDIAHALRAMTSSDGFLDGNGARFTPNTNLNRLSMRGPWTSDGVFDSWQQSLVFPDEAGAVTTYQYSDTRGRRIGWAPWTAGQTYRFKVAATGGSKLEVRFLDATSKATVATTGALGDGASTTFLMPAATAYPILVATTGAGTGATVRGTIVAE